MMYGEFQQHPPIYAIAHEGPNIESQGKLSLSTGGAGIPAGS